jgi:hypothetical protein
MHDQVPLAPDSEHCQDVSIRLAAFLASKKEQIVSHWLSAIQHNRSIPSTEETPEPQLIDHVPKLLDGIVDLLRSSPKETMPAEMVEDAREHAVHRFKQGYELDEMLRELGEFRSVLILHTGAFGEEDSQLVGIAQSKAARRIHRFLDESGRISTVRFVQEQKTLLTKANDARLHLLRGVSHELGNALNGVSWAAVTLTGADPTQLKEAQKAIQRGVQFMKEMIDDLQTLACLDSGEERLKPAPFAPLAVAQDITSIYGKMAADKGLQFIFEVDPSLPEVVSDEARVKQVAVNLVSNAVKYTASGEVRVKFGTVDAERWAITVSDTGVGIAADHQQKIFDEFFRVDATSSAEGMGLGLAIATRLVRLLGGETRIESKVGRGSCFEVVLPKVLRAPFST